MNSVSAMKSISIVYLQESDERNVQVHDEDTMIIVLLHTKYTILNFC